MEVLAAVQFRIEPVGLTELYANFAAFRRAANELAAKNLSLPTSSSSYASQKKKGRTGYVNSPFTDVWELFSR